MATKVQGKNYLPGYYSTRDIDEDATSRWSSFYHGKKLSEHAYNGYIPWLVNECSEHEKEKLKRTMLEHEVIFQNQVYELHRLYRIQKDLMNEFQSRGLYGSSIVAETSQSNSFTSRKWSECTEKISQTSHLYGGNTNYGKTPLSGNERPHDSSIREGSVQSDHIILLNGTLQNEKDIDHRSRKRRKYDLQLPADVYVDSEDNDVWGQKNFNVSSSSATIPKNGTHSLCSDDDVKLTLGSNQHVSNTISHIDVSTCRLVDLNKSTAEVDFERPVDSTPVQLLGLNTVSKWNQSQHSSLRSSVCFRDGHGGQQTSADFLYPDVHKRMEWPSFDHETGKNRSTMDFLSHSSDPTKLCGTLQLSSQKCHGILFDHNHPEKWYEKETNHSIQRPLGFSHFNHSSPVLMSNSVPASITTLQADLTSRASPFASPWRNPASTIADKPEKQLPYLSGSSNFVNEGLRFKVDAQSPNACEKWQKTRNSSTGIESGIAVSRTSGFYRGLDLDSDPVAQQNIHGNQPRNHLKGPLSRDFKTPISVNLNQTCASVIEDKLSIMQDRGTNDTESKYSKLPKGPSWFNGAESFGEQKLAPRVDFSFPNRHWQLFSSSNDAERKADKELGLSLHKLQEMASNSLLNDQKEKEVSENSGKRIFGLLIHDIVKQNDMPLSVRHSESHLTRNAKFLESDNKVTIDMYSDTEVLNSQKNVHVADLNSADCGGKNSARILNHINLNIKFGCSDDPTSPEIFPHDEAGISSRSVPSVSTKAAVAIDLEAPVSQSEMSILNQHEPIPSSKKDGSIDLEAPVSQSEMSILNQHEPIPSSKKDGAEKKNHSDDAVQLAARKLVAISMDFHTRSNEINPDHLLSPGSDTLSWFAEVVSRSAEDPDLLRTGAGGSLSSGHDGLDFFEAMTLNLEETKIDEHWPKEIKNKDEKEDKEDLGVASMLFTKPRRGQARKRRQRRDFQKDILPGLASLSRHEVTQDLQNIGGMMKASGGSWLTGLTRRNASRNGFSSQARGRRQLRSLVNAIEEVQVSSLPQSQPINTEIGVCGRSMIGWGRTTRRCRRQRCGPVSLPAAFTSEGPCLL